MIEIRQGGKRENLQLEEEQNLEKNAETEIQKEKKERIPAFQPKNFRQIGSPSGQQKIYFEDYVYTYLHPLSETAEETRVCILLGRVEKERDLHYIFISGAVELPGIEFAGNTPIFLDRVREEICALIKQHFEGLYLVGWYLDLKGNTPKLTPELERIHRNFFGGRDKVLLLSDSLNREEKLFACENNAIWQKEGYYIYYEKNPRMQDYMISARAEEENTIQPEEVVDEALKNYREILMQKEEKTPGRFRVAFYSTGVLLLFTICVLGINMFNNYDKMKKLEGAVSALSGSVDTEIQTEMSESKNETENHVVIETIDGKIEKNTELKTAVKNTENQEKNTEVKPPVSTEKESTETDSAVHTTDTPSDAGNTQKSQESSDDAASTGGDPVTPPLTEAETIRLQGYYIVQKGETLAAITRKIYGNIQKLEEICVKNGIDNSDEIYAGQKLLLP